jgi:hypothetical protein
MPIEVWGSDEAGHLMLMPDPSPPAPAAPQASTPPEGEPPLPGADAPAPVAEPPPAAAPPDDLAALRRLIEERDRAQQLKEAQRDARDETLLRVLRGEPPPAETPAGPPLRPKAEDFTTQEAFDQAQDTWIDQRATHAAQTAWQQAQQVSQQQQAAQSLDVRTRQAEDAFVQTHPDYIQVVQSGLVAKTPVAFRQLIMQTDDAPAVAYAIAKDEALLGRLMQMPPPQLLYALGRLSAQHGGSAPPPEPPAVPGVPQGGGPPGGRVPVAGAPKPAPPRPLSGTGVAPVGGYRDDMSMAEYRVWKKSVGGDPRP